MGRDGLRMALADAVPPVDASVPVDGIEGLAGVGKTTLAVRIGHEVAANFPDGRLFLDLGAAGEPLAELLRGIGVPTAGLPESFSERVALWRTLTTGSRLLAVLDDADAAEQVRPLLPGVGGSAVVITSRQRLYGLAYVRWQQSGGLTEDESVTLLEGLVGVQRVRAEPAGCASWSRGRPQVLRAVGARLAFRLLSMADGPNISVAAASAVLNLSSADSAALLESLVDVHLLEPGGLDRYFYHKPPRIFARGRAFAEDGQAASQAARARLAEFLSPAE